MYHKVARHFNPEIFNPKLQPRIFPPTDFSAVKSLTHSMATGILNNTMKNKALPQLKTYKLSD